MEAVSHIYADIVAQNRNNHPVLFVEVKARPAGKEAVLPMSSFIRPENGTIPFIMLADPDDIRVFQWDGTHLVGPLSSLKTVEVLRHYDPELGSKPLFEFYLHTLVEAWLRDLAYHWKSESPPGSEQLEAIGLLQQIEGGTTQSEVELGREPLR